MIGAVGGAVGNMFTWIVSRHVGMQEAGCATIFPEKTIRKRRPKKGGICPENGRLRPVFSKNGQKRVLAGLLMGLSERMKQILISRKI